MSTFEPFQDTHDGTDLAYRMTEAAAQSAARAGLTVDEVLQAANDPDRVLTVRLDGSRMGHLRGDVSAIVDPAEGTIVRAAKTVWIDAAIGLVA